jgi:hypothetical protein
MHGSRRTGGRSNGVMRIRNGNWMAFLAMCFGVVGLVGVFGTYAAPLPLERALARDAALDAAAAAATRPDPQATIAALKPQLGREADALLPAGPDLPARITAARAAMRARFLEQADAEGRQMRLMIGVVTLMAAVFGMAILAIAGKQ